MLKRFVIGCLLAIGVSGCAGGPALFGPSTGTVTGHVTLRACGGAYRAEQAGCPAQPLAGATVAFRLTSGGDTSARTVVTDAGGAYRVELAPGVYTVTLTSIGHGPAALSPPAIAPAVGSAPRQVTVVAGKTVTADFTYTIQLM
jgi:Carboxypeptidase regulatory-like domain